MEVFNRIKNQDQLDYLMQGISMQSANATENEAVAETLFFYPLIGLLYNLASEVTED
jgi:hypothetical protein